MPLLGWQNLGVLPSGGENELVFLPIYMENKWVVDAGFARNQMVRRTVSKKWVVGVEIKTGKVLKEDNCIECGT